ncbi:kinetochore complex Fta4 of Sim4 subunit, or CENP-50-domain-containing protein [Phyllosticta citrichinensis]|uniref:Kinetochore complex Fta4 of Sim4 subunit, or CENP-50-domain-containing protein n=1 Tax=Phyllosticta citrichinensis TaxID=1130410 RepID=A0ABR1XH45_9PEZI
MSGANTVIDLKSAFIRRQTRILSQPLQAPQQWKDDCNIPDAAVRSAMREVNRRLVRHNKTAYPSISIRHTAETIDNLYWQRSAPNPVSSHSSSAQRLDPSTSAASSSSAIDVDPFHPSADLTSPATIASLPPSWSDVDDDQARALLPPSKPTTSSSKPQQPQRQQQTSSYTTHASTLHALSARRTALRRQLSRYKALHAALVPLADPERNVQPNLATRDGALAGEMARLRALGVRVAARVGARREGDEGEGREGKEMVEKGDEGEGEDEDGLVVCETDRAERERERRKLGRVLEW